MTIFLVGFVALLAGLCLALVVWTAVAARRAERLVPPPGRSLVIDGIRLHYVDEGEGPVIFMLHGLGSQLQTFRYALSARLKDRYRVIALDRPGCGYSRAPLSERLADQPALFAKFLAALDVDRALVIGHSLGGALGLALAIDHPERCAGLVLFGPATQVPSEPPSVLRGLFIRSDIVRWLIGWLVAAPVATFGGAAQIGRVFAPEPVPADFGTRAGGFLQGRPHAVRWAARDLTEATDALSPYIARHAVLTMPIAILFGADDAILDPQLHAGTFAEQVPGTEVELIDGAGHMLPITRPDECLALIETMAARAFEGQLHDTDTARPDGRMRTRDDMVSRESGT